MVEAVYGRGHLTSIQGILKLIEIVFLILLSFLISYYGWGHVDVLKALIAGSIIGLLVSALLLTLGCSGTESPGILLKLQCFFHFSWFLYFIVSSSYFLSEYDNSDDIYKAGCAFGILAAITYLADGIHSYLVYRPFP